MSTKREDNLDDDVLLAQLANVVGARNAQDAVLWMVFSAFCTANAILLVALFPNGSIATGPMIPAIIAAAGTFMSFLWHRIQSRAIGHLARLEVLTGALEDDLGLPLSRRIKGQLDPEFNTGIPPHKARDLMLLSSKYSFWVWGVALLWMMFTSAAGFVAAGIAILVLTVRWFIRTPPAAPQGTTSVTSDNMIADPVEKGTIETRSDNSSGKNENAPEKSAPPN